MRRTTALIGLATVVPVVALAILEGQRPGPTQFFARLDGTRVMRIDAESGAEQQIYHAEAAAVLDLQISPTQDYLAFIEARIPAGQAYPRNQLVVLTPNGERVTVIDRDVQRYVWCGRTCLACIVGDYYEGGLGFKSKGAFAYEVLTGRETPITGIRTPYDLAWATFDSALYLKGPPSAGGAFVFRYDPRTNSLASTPYKDFGFSPSGRYYLQVRGEESDSTKLYETLTNRQVPLPNLAGSEPAGWVFERGDFLLVTRKRVQDRSVSGPVTVRRGPPPEVRYAIYDVQSRRVVRELTGSLAPWVRPKGLLPLMSGGRLSVLSQP